MKRLERDIPKLHIDKGELSIDDPPAVNTVELPFVRQGTHSYQVRYAYYTKEYGNRGDDVRKEAWRTEEAWCAADAVVQVAIYVDSLYASSRCKILEVKPCLT